MTILMKYIITVFDTSNKPPGARFNEFEPGLETVQPLTFRIGD